MEHAAQVPDEVLSYLLNQESEENADQHIDHVDRTARLINNCDSHHTETNDSKALQLSVLFQLTTSLLLLQEFAIAGSFGIFIVSFDIDENTVSSPLRHQCSTLFRIPICTLVCNSFSFAWRCPISFVNAPVPLFFSAPCN